jgi:quercetin dioxygenase-like cupin family protein
MGNQGEFCLMGDRITVIHSGDDYGMLQLVTLPEAPGPPPHYMERSSVLYHVIEGRLDIRTDGAWRTLGRYESIRLPEGTLHALRNSSDREVTWLACWCPGGPERMVIDLGVPAAEDKACERSISEDMVRRLIANHRRYGMRIPELEP